MTTWTDLPAMAKIEVVIDGDDVPVVRDLFLDAGATGYTAVSGVSCAAGAIEISCPGDTWKLGMSTAAPSTRT